MAVPSGIVSSSASLSSASSVSSSSSSPSSSTSRPAATALADTTDTDTVNDVETISDKQQGIVYQYYFLILVLGVFLFIGTLLIMRRRRNRRKMNAANLGRHALARDLESWQPASHNQHTPQSRMTPPTTARRWMQRYNRFGTRHPNRIPEEDEAGLNEFGEAPPPYISGKSGMDHDRRDSHTDNANNINNSNMPAVPLRTLSRNAVGKPPGYEESLRPVDSNSSLAVDETQARPTTQQTDASTSNLLARPQSSSAPTTNLPADEEPAAATTKEEVFTSTPVQPR